MVISRYASGVTGTESQEEEIPQQLISAFAFGGKSSLNSRRNSSSLPQHKLQVQASHASDPLFFVVVVTTTMTTTMVATMHHQRVEQQEIDPRLVVPLCIRENRLEGDYLLPPDSPHSTKATLRLDPGVLASPTSIIEAIECLPDKGDIKSIGGEEDKHSNSKKKKKKSKGKLFRSKRNSAKDEAERTKKEVLRRAALQMKRIQ